MPAPAPLEVVEPFGVNAADPTSITLPIPVPSQIGITPGAASFNDGFPPLTMEPIIAGGVPPYGQDMNGILYTITSHLAALNGGQLYDYSASWASATGGYDLGAVLTMLDDTGLWFNLVDNNMTNPDTGGAGWVPVYSYGYTTMTGLSGGTVVLTSAQHKRATIILQGVLSSNLVLEFPTDLRTWLVVNETTGPHTTTCKTVAGSNTVIIPQGGLPAPVSIYGDGTDVWPTVAPLSVASDIAATPLTLVERDSAGNVFAVYLNSNVGLENPVIGAVLVQNSTADGYLRKISLANFLATALNNPALTGNAVAPTPTAGDNSTKIATTAFVTQAASGAAKASANFRWNGSSVVGTFVNCSVVRLSLGLYRVTFTTPMASAGYAALTGGTLMGPPAWTSHILADNTFAFTTTQFVINCRWSNDATTNLYDPATVTFAVFE